MTSLRFPRGLYGITPNWADTNKLMDAITQAHAGGMTALQWRRKDGNPADLEQQAKKIQQLCKQLGLVFIINDNLELAHQLKSDGVHLGKDDGSMSEARKTLGKDRIIGCSCYNRLDLAEQAIKDDADYVAFGAVYHSPTKPDAPHAGLDLISKGKALAASQQYQPSVVTIGGITTENAGNLIKAGADNIAVISSLFDTQDITTTAKTFTAMF